MTRAILLAMVSLITLAASSASANGYATRYEVTITNITKGQTFTPILAATHSPSISIFELGSPASTELEILAEGGDTAPLAGVIDAAGGSTTASEGLLAPGESVSLVVEARRGRNVLSVAAMLIPTNDTFFALNGVRLPWFGPRSYDAPGYDAGTEANDQSCGSMPGPRCGGEGHSPGPNEGDEGFVHIGNGFHDLGEVDEDGNEVLGPFTYDWRNSVARVVVRRIR